jgi:pre-mRNA-splicing factor 18
MLKSFLDLRTSTDPLYTNSIHERSAREKISSSQVAHVLNDESSRKWIQSVKRLMTFAQTKYPPYTLSQIS